MSIAFVYSGQGAQFAGMGKDFYEKYPVVQDIFHKAEKVLGYPLEEICFEENEKLFQTRYTQPAMLTVSFAIDSVLAENGIQPDMAAGLSLGEYTALVKAGAFTFEDAVGLIAKRGQFMSEAVPAGEGKMVAVMNCPRKLIYSVCEEASKVDYVAPANFNMPSQVVIGGTRAGVDRAVELFEKEGIRRLIPVNVSGPFHTRLMHPAAVLLETELKKTAVGDMQLPVIGNVFAEVIQKEALVELLTRQVESPVLWEDSVKKMIDMGADVFVEVGPGKTLSKFIKKIDKNVTVLNVEDLESLDRTLTFFKTEIL